jgi:Ion channel
MTIVLALLSVLFILVVLLDGFESMVLPRRITRFYRPARLFYRATWLAWRAVACALGPGRRRQSFLSYYGPLSLLLLFATWVTGLILGFALLHWSLHTGLNPAESPPDFPAYVYLSGTTFFTLGYGDVTPVTRLGRALAVVEAGIGFGFMALIIGYLPVLYQAFSRREVTISLLDARAGSPPSSAQLLVRLVHGGRVASVDPFLGEWERWAAELLESHLSFPVLSFYRSQHDNQSWLTALTAVLDTCALLLAAVKVADPYQVQLTFAMARHAAVDLALVFNTPPRKPDPDRLSYDQFQRLRQSLQGTGLALHDGPAVEERLTELRGMYEPFVNALAHYLLFTLPAIVPEKPAVDNWQTSAWMRRAPGIGHLPAPDGDEHFD